MNSVYKRIALFVGGTLVGSVGLKLLTSKDAKNAYTHVVAAGLRVKDFAMETATTVQETVADILADAKQMNLERAEREEIVEDTSEEIVEDTFAEA